MNVPGFRRGKAPARMIEKMVGAERIKQEALERYLPYLFAEVLSKQELDVVAPPRITSCVFELGAPLVVEAELDLRPQVSLPDSLVLAVEVPEPKLLADAKEKAIAQRLQSLASLEEVAGRPSEATDVLTIDFEGKVDGKSMPGGSAENFVVDLKQHQLLEGFVKPLLGRNAGDVFEFDLTFPEDYFDDGLANKVAQFKVTLHKIETPVVPELNDEAVARLGAFDSVAAFDASVSEQLNQGVEAEKTRRIQHQVVQALLQAVPVTLHAFMVEREVELYLSDLEQRLKGQGMNLQELLGGDPARKEEMISTFAGEASRRLQTSLIFGAIAKQEGLRVSDDELQQEVLAVATAEGMDEKQLMRQLSQQGTGLQVFLDQLLAKKVLALLAEKATVTWVEEPEKPVAHTHEHDGVPCSHDHSHDHEHEGDVLDDALASSIDVASPASTPEASLPVLES